MDASVKMIDRNTAVVEDGATAASAILVSDDVPDLEFVVDTSTIDVAVVAKNAASLENILVAFGE